MTYLFDPKMTEFSEKLATGIQFNVDANGRELMRVRFGDGTSFEFVGDYALCVAEGAIAEHEYDSTLTINNAA